MLTARTPTRKRTCPIIVAGWVIGCGFGGFFDGIVFHQILQWHHMLSSTTPVTTLNGLALNTLADGLFHAGAYVVMAVGLWLLWRATRLPDVSHATHILVGAILAGAGSFNVIEGTINHQILGIHHVRPGTDQLAYDLAFLAAGAILIAIGILLIRRTPRSKS